MVMGGGRAKLRDAAPAAFLVGHSLAYWLQQAATVPVYLLREGRLTVPCDLRTLQGPISGWVHAAPPAMTPRVAAAA